MDGVSIARSGAEIYYTRHAEPITWPGVVDSPLGEKGIQQAKNLTGHYSCVVVTPLRRSKETLHHSQITYDTLHLAPDFRERVFSPVDQLPLEPIAVESDAEFFSRLHRWHRELEDLCKHHPKILLIGHAYFFNAWYRQGCYPSPAYAQIMAI